MQDVASVEATFQEKTSANAISLSKTLISQLYQKTPGLPVSLLILSCFLFLVCWHCTKLNDDLS